MKFFKWKKICIFYDLIQALVLNFSYILKPKVYEKEGGVNRGELALLRYEDGKERCIACKLCETICPVQAIFIDSVIGDDGITKTTKHDVDLSKCIYCGLCQEACPKEAIVLTSNTNVTAKTSDGLIYSKDKLLENGEAFKKDEF